MWDDIKIKQFFVVFLTTNFIVELVAEKPQHLKIKVPQKI
jgi:hypothetical protein